EAFFSNKDAFPDFPDDLPKLILAQDWETVKTKYFEKSIFDFGQLLQFIHALFKKEVDEKGLLRRSGFNIISFIFKIADDEKYKNELLDTFYGKGKPLSNIKTRLNNTKIKELILSFNPALLLNFV